MTPSKKEIKDSRIITGEGPPQKKSLAQKIPLWGWVFIFIFPLVLSEFMFYVVGKWMSMILFGIAWVGFWLALMVRSDWAIFKNRNKED